MEQYKSEYPRFAVEPRSQFRCLGFLLKHREYVRQVTLLDMVSCGWGMDEETLYLTAELAYEYPPLRLESVVPFSRGNQPSSPEDTSSSSSSPGSVTQIPMP